MKIDFEDLTLIELTRVAHAVVAKSIAVSETDGQALLEYLCLRQAEVRYLEYLIALDQEDNA